MASHYNEIQDFDPLEDQPLIVNNNKKFCNKNRFVIMMLFLFIITSIIINIYFFMTFKYYISKNFDKIPNIEGAIDKLDHLDKRLNNLFDLLCNNYKICV